MNFAAVAVHSSFVELIVVVEPKICATLRHGGKPVTFLREVGSRRTVCDECLANNVRETIARSPHYQKQSPVDGAWENLKTEIAALDQVVRAEVDTSHIAARLEVECLRKFPYTTHEQARKVIKRKRGHKSDRTGSEVYRCRHQIPNADEEARRGVHYHIGGNHYRFALGYEH